MQHQPPPLLQLAPLFERVLILCFNSTCDNQLARWPRAMHSRIELIDGMLMDKELHIGPSKSHHYRVALTFAKLAREHLARYENVLVLEADFLEIGAQRVEALPQPQVDAQLAAARRFLKEEQWSVLRLGYDLYYWHADDPKSNNVKGASWLVPGAKGSERRRCRQECKCQRSKTVDWICSITHNAYNRVCPMGSTVATALHNRARQALSSYGFGMQFGFIPDQPRTNVDIWITMTFTPIHHLIPARVVQNQVHKVTHHSGTKSARVLLNHTPEVAAANMLQFAADCVDKE